MGFLRFLIIEVALALPVIAEGLDVCFAAIQNGTYGSNGTLDNFGHPVNYANVTAISYQLCKSACGTKSERFSWPYFGFQFGSWLLPWLSIIPQLPFGAQFDSDNINSILLALGSPTLAAYSLMITVLNGKWITRMFSGIRYPNVDKAWKVLCDLQQSGLYVDVSEGLLASLVILPENNEWWEELVHDLNYAQTWSAATFAQIVWVIIAFFFNLVNSYDDLSGNAKTTGQSVGSAYLWLLPIVIGWLQISPRCDFERIHSAVQRANDRAYIATPDGTAILARNITGRRAFILKTSEGSVVSRDETISAPIYNYARFLPWTSNVEIVVRAFRAAASRAINNKPVNSEKDWVHGSKGEVMDENRRGNLEQIRQYTLSTASQDTVRLDSDVLSRFLIASAFALLLQWGTIGGSIIVLWFAPTRGLGCRSGAYTLYAILSTVVWILMVLSSFLSHYCVSASSDRTKSRGKASYGPLSGRLATLFRKSGKVLATLNSIWVLLTCLFDFSRFFNNCYCNSSVLGLGPNSAYLVYTLTDYDVDLLKSAWIGAVILSLCTAVIFEGFVTLNINPPAPKP